MKQVGKEKHTKHQKMIKKVKQAYKKNSPAIYKNLSHKIKSKLFDNAESTEMLFSDGDDISVVSGDHSSTVKNSAKFERKRPVDPA